MIFLRDDHCTVLRKASQKPTKEASFFCPTATCQVIGSFLECGVEFVAPFNIAAPAPLQEVALETTSEVKLPPRFPGRPHYGRFISLLLNCTFNAQKTEEIQSNWISTALKSKAGQLVPPAWLCAVLQSSQHFDSQRVTLREAIFYSNLLRTIQGSWKYLPSAQTDKIIGEITNAAVAIIYRIRDALDPKADEQSGRVPRSAYLMLHSAYSLVYATRLLNDLGYRGISQQSLVEAMAWIRQHLTTYFDGLSHRLMAKRWAGDDFQYDVVSLACAVAGWDLLDESARKSAFFSSCLGAIVADQLSNGCWPDGASVVIASGGETIQLPSVEVALCLAKAAFKRDYLVDAGPPDVALMKVAYPALRLHCQYLSTSRQTIEDDPDKFSGWTSDRTRIFGDIEAWTTSAAATVFHNTYLIERALRREQILQKYSALRHRNIGLVRTGPKASICGYWDESVIEPELISRPLSTIRKSFLETIEEQERQERTIVKLLSDGVSVLIFGPPGSGKTHLINTLSKTTGWPLIELNPGNFIERGLELIEAVAGQVFRDLCSLEHAIVFFDECDELFKSRDQNLDGQARNIASFVTAAMLPKLQKLHDARRVIFVVATNYLHLIDDAIRRPGRFDNLLLLDRPHLEARRNFIKTALQKRPASGEIDLNRLVDASIGLTFPEILSIIRDYPKLPTADRLRKMRADYDKWCRDRWDMEAAAGGLTSEQIVQIAASRVQRVVVEEA
jgi:hypothetical protein